MRDLLFPESRKSMAYKLIISRKADENIDNIINYLVVNLSNRQAAEAVIEDIDDAYRKLEERAESYAYCSDSYLASKGYRKLPLSKHSYIILYRVEGDDVFISGVFHTRENYLQKL